MKTMLSLTLLFAAAGSLYGQTINDIPIKDIDVDYMEIVGSEKLLASKVDIYLDFGRSVEFPGGNKLTVKDAAGKPVRLVSTVDAINFMAKQGYDLVTAYAVTAYKTNLNEYHFLLKRSSKGGEEEKATAKNESLTQEQ